MTINYDDEKYPKKLKNIFNPPEKIYVNGNIENFNTPCLAVVGSRGNTEYGEKWCQYFVKKFVKYGITIVSGMAVGIDAIAHKTALKYGGKTIAVLPSGFDNIFPKENIELYKEILKSNNTIVTEYVPSTKANSKRFLERNRIVSGLSLAVLVVEAAYRSGTSVTARIALSQGKKVFCIPRKSKQF